MAERNELKSPPSGISASPQAVVRQARLGPRYLGVSSGTITEEMVKQYISEQEGESIQDESRFVEE